MSPAKKKSKPNDFSDRDQPSQEQPPVAGETKSPKSSSRVPTDAQPATDSSNSRPNSWYNGGSWRAKASPVAQVARESISVDRGTTSEASAEAARRPSQSVIKGMKGTRKSVPLLAEPTMVHATSEPGDKGKSRLPSRDQIEDGKPEGAGESGQQKGPAVVLEEAPLPPETTALVVPAIDGAKADSAKQPGKWFGWWSRPDGYSTDGEGVKGSNTKRKLPDTDEASKTPLPGTPAVSPAGPDEINEPEVPPLTGETPTNQARAANTTQLESDMPNLHLNSQSTRSWFGIWSKTQNQQAKEENRKEPGPEPAPVPTPEIALPPEDVAKKDEPAQLHLPKETEEQPRASGWAFWSTDKVKDLPQTPSGTQRQVGELAVADTPSQSHPEAAQFNQQPDPQKSTKLDTKSKTSLLKPKRGRVEKGKDTDTESLAPSIASNSGAVTPAISRVPTPVDTPLRDDSIPAPVQRGKQSRPNLILPAFQDVYSTSSSPGYLERLAQYLAQTLRIHGSAPPPPPQHVYISTSHRKIKKAIAIGVHGFFPAPLLQKVLGQPTGTSIRFANYAAASIKAWCHEKQPDVKEVEIETVALEGEGFIADRVDTLWKLMLNWLSHLRQADFILVACHSQGVPVAVMLVAKLIQLGCLSPHVRIGVCAMAGINLGPFPEYKSRLFGGTALELFDFCDSNSRVSKSYADSLDVCLRHGVRVTFVGSIDDQLVSLESSLHAPLSHPYVSRAVFIDGRLHTPNFLTHLVVFALKLRNLGIPDHGLIRELSGPLAGSLVGGDGHSRVYDDPAVYGLAIAFALESTDMSSSASAAATALAASTAAGSLLATDPARARTVANARRASLSGYPPNAATANQIRRGSISASTQLPGIPPIIASYTSTAMANQPVNPFYLPWAVRGMLEEEVVRNDDALGTEVETLVREFEEWKPVSKVLKDVKWRLEGVRSML